MSIDTVCVQNRILHIKKHIDCMFVPQCAHSSYCPLPCHSHNIHRSALSISPHLIHHTVNLRSAISCKNFIWLRNFIPRMFFQITIRINYRIVRLFRRIVAAEQTRKTLSSPTVCIVDSPESHTRNRIRMFPVNLKQFRIHLCLRNFLLLGKSFR